MTTDGHGRGDVLGLAAYGEALNTLSKGAVDGAGAFLSRICLASSRRVWSLIT